MKIDRLFQIVILLLNKGTLTASQLAKHFGVTARTIYRDIETLSVCGIPVTMTPGHNGGIQLLDDYTLSRTYFSDAEKDNILLALQTLNVTDFPDADRALKRMASLFRSVPKEPWITVDYVPWGSQPHNFREFDQIRSSILDRRYVEFHYTNSSNEQKQVKIEPHQLIFKGAAWYLKGWDTAKRAFRTYKLTRMKNFQICENHFETPHQKQNEKSASDVTSCSAPLLILHFHPDTLYRLYDNFTDSDMTHNEDGTITVQARFPVDEWLYGYLLSFGDKVQVLEPAKIREHLAERIDRMYRLYHPEIFSQS